jgi:hypothetical protein
MTFQILSFEFRQRCENIALTQRHELGLYGYSPLPARTLAAQLSVDIYFPHEIAGLDTAFADQLANSLAWSAITIPLNPPLIVASPTHSAARFESDVMHELAHLLLSHKPEQLGSLNDQYASRYVSRD